MSDDIIDFEVPEKYPLDVEKLNKGQQIGVVDCERILGRRRDDLDYRFKLLGLRDWIENEAESLALNFTLVTRYEGLYVIRDEESEDQHDQAVRASMRKIVRAHRILIRTDRSMLTTEQQRRLDEKQCRTAMRIASMRSVARKALPEQQPMGLPPALAQNEEINENKADAEVPSK